jgi:regulator of RNase E activity RraA
LKYFKGPSQYITHFNLKSSIRMGRKPSNVYDYFDRSEQIDGKGLVRYTCKKCSKQYAANATRLAEHLKMTGCFPGFESNQRSLTLGDDTDAPRNSIKSANSSVSNRTMSANIVADAVVVGASAAPVTTVAHSPYISNPHVLQGFNHKKADHLIHHVGMLDTEMGLDTDILLRLAKLSTCSIADAMVEMGIQGFLSDVNLLDGYDHPLGINICGPAFTVKIIPSTGAEVKKLPFNYIDSAEMGQVIVISAPKNSTNAVFDALTSVASKVRSVAGVVTDGRVRGLQDLCALSFPAFARGTSPNGMRGALEVVDVGCPIIVAGVVVRNADIIRGDINGVVIVPLELAPSIAEKAELIEAAENKIMEAIHHGEPLQRALQRFY